MISQELFGGVGGTDGRWEGKLQDRAAAWASVVLGNCKVNLALKREALGSQSKAMYAQPCSACLPPCTEREGRDWGLEGSWIQDASIGKDCAGVEPLEDEGKGGESALGDTPAPVPVVQCWQRNGSKAALG